MLVIAVVVGDLVELFLKPGCEVIFHIAREEAFEEGGDDASLVFRHEALFVDAHIVTVAQHRERRGIGRRAPDAEFFHALDQCRFREARRRLGEMLVGLDALLRQAVTLRHRRQAAAVLVVLVVLAFLV